MKKAYLVIPLVISIGLVIIPAAYFSSSVIITVKSDSMFPTLNLGDQLVTKQVDINEIKEGDIIALDTHFEHTDIIINRVIEISEKNGKIEIITKGDHDDYSETWINIQDSLIGLVSEVNHPLLVFQADAVRYPLVAIAVISSILLVKEFLKNKAVQVEQLYCFRCNNRWYPRIIEGKVKIPDTCPNKDCRSPYWHTPRKKNNEK